MCILFINNGTCDDSDYCLILASNRDENLDRPASNAAPWMEDQNIIGGRDMEKGREGGTWLALSPTRAKIGILLNLTGNPKPNPKARGNIVADYVKTVNSTSDYIKTLQPFAKEFNDFSLVTIEIGCNKCKVQSYTNITNILVNWEDKYLGFGNSLPDTPLKKVEAGKNKFMSICQQWNKISNKDKLVEELINLLRWNELHLPDPELERRCPGFYDHLSSVFVRMPQGRYGTRTHTIILVTKTGRMDFIELTLQPPVDLSQPNWLKTQFQFNI